MDSSSGVLRGRPHGGIAILWKKSLNGFSVTDVGNARVMKMQFETTNQSVTLFNVYMPVDDRENVDVFLEIMTYISSAVVEMEVPYVAMIGDFNANMSPSANTLFGNELSRFCNDEQLKISDVALCDKDSFTFYSEAHKSISWLDHCVCNASLHCSIKSITILYDYVTSDHLPLHIEFDISKPSISTFSETVGHSGFNVRWNKLSSDELTYYATQTDANLDAVKLCHNLILCDNPDCKDVSHIASLERMYESIISALSTAATSLKAQVNDKKHVKYVPGWNDMCRELHANARSAFLVWVRNGRPRAGLVMQNMQRTRAAFKQALRRCKNAESRVKADALARKLLSKDTKEFWKEIKRINGKDSSTLPATVGKATGPSEIAAQWQNHYSTILNSNPPSQWESVVHEQISKCSILDVTFNVEEVSKAIQELKLNKACGLDGLSAEHFRFACPKLAVLLCICFNCFLVHGCVPKGFSDSIIVPVIKDKKGNVTDMDNYRPIAITSIASKTFEKLVLGRLQNVLSTNDNQFSFKSKHSSDMCIFTLKSIIDYYLMSSSPVYVCYLDASKAFDRIDYWYLFHRLIDCKVPLILVRFLMIWYCTQEFVVRWGAQFSEPFLVSNGVRQGGILSPYLFNIYMDDLSTELNYLTVGCMFNGFLYNHLLYADDMVLLAPSIRALQTLIAKCSEFANDHSILYNTKKTVCMCFRPQVLKCKFDPIVVLADKQIKCVSSHKYLGVFITCNQKDDISIEQQMKNVYVRGNMIIRNFKHCSESVKCQLFKSYCTSFYCSPLWCYNTMESVRRLKVAYNRIFRILMGLMHRTSMSFSFISRGLDPLPVLLRKSIVSFRKRLFNCDNMLVRNIVYSKYFIFSNLNNKWDNYILCRQ